MLDAKDFVDWGNENVVLVVGHDGATGKNEPHKSIEVKDKDGTKSVCPLYPGLTCDEHKKIRADVGSPADGFGKIEVPSGFPNTWMVGPDGSVQQMDNAKSGTPKGCQDALTEFQKKFEGKPLSLKKYEEYKKALSDGDKGVADGRWKVALTAYAKLDADAKKLSKALNDKVKAKLDAVNAKVVEAFGKIKDGDGDAATKLKGAKALRLELGTKLSTGFLPVVADMDAWIRDAAAAAGPAK